MPSPGTESDDLYDPCILKPPKATSTTHTANVSSTSKIQSPPMKKHGTALDGGDGVRLRIGYSMYAKGGECHLDAENVAIVIRLSVHSKDSVV